MPNLQVPVNGCCAQPPRCGTGRRQRCCAAAMMRPPAVLTSSALAPAAARRAHANMRMFFWSQLLRGSTSLRLMVGPGTANQPAGDCMPTAVGGLSNRPGADHPSSPCMVTAWRCSALAALLTSLLHRASIPPPLSHHSSVSGGATLLPLHRIAVTWLQRAPQMVFAPWRVRPSLSKCMEVRSDGSVAYCVSMPCLRARAGHAGRSCATKASACRARSADP